MGDIIAELLSSVPETERKIAVCEMAARCDPPSERDLKGELSRNFRRTVMTFRIVKGGRVWRNVEILARC